MKKLVFIVAISLFVVKANAQSFENGIFITSQTFEDEMMLSSDKGGTINRTKKIYNIIGQLYRNAATLYTTWAGIHPDTNTVSVFNSMVGSGGVASRGQIFDPKSPVWYDNMTWDSYAISEAAAYTIDTFVWSGAYFRPQLGPVNDTLKIQFFLEPNMSYHNDSSITFNRAFCIPTYDPVLKGGLNADTTINVIFDDNSAQGVGIEGIIPLGLHVPAGYEVGVTYSFIPGSPYKAGDTTCVLKPDTLTPGNINCFWMRGAIDNDNHHHEDFYNYNFGVQKGQYYDPWGLMAMHSVSHNLMAFFITYDDFTGIDHIDPTGLSIYPNPANDYVMVENDDEEATFELMDQSGRVLQSQSLSRGVSKIELKHILSGLYFVRINQNIQRLIIR